MIAFLNTCREIAVVLGFILTKRNTSLTWSNLTLVCTSNSFVDQLNKEE